MNTRSSALKHNRKNGLFPWIAFLAAAAAIGLSPSLSRGATPFVPITRYAVESVDLYQQPSFDARISIELEKGTPLLLIHQQGDWFAARLPNERLGWIHRKHLSSRPPAEPAAPPRPEEPAAPAPLSDGLYTVEVTVDSGRIRSAPNLEGPVQLGVTRGERAVVIETEGKWRRIRLPDGRTGWGHRMLFSEIDAEGGAAQTFPMETGPTAEAETGAEIGKLPDEKTLQSVSATIEEAGEEKAVFQLNGFHPPETFVIEEGAPKVVCDFKGVRPGKALPRRIAVDGDMIRRIRIGVHSDLDPKVRVVVDLARDRSYSVEQVFIKGKGQYILIFKPAEAAD